MPMTYLPETGTRFWFQKLVSESGIGLWYQLQLEADFLVPDTNMADDADELGAVYVMAVIVVKQRENRK